MQVTSKKMAVKASSGLHTPKTICWWLRNQVVLSSWNGESNPFFGLVRRRCRFNLGHVKASDTLTMKKIYHSFWEIWTKIPGKDYINTLPYLNMDTHLSQRLVGSYFLFLPLWYPIHYLETLGDCTGLGVPLSSFISIVTSESCHHLTWVQFHPFPFYKRWNRLITVLI